MTTTIRNRKALLLARAILAATASVWCASSAARAQERAVDASSVATSRPVMVAAQSANDINRIGPTRDLTRSIPSSGPSTSGPSTVTAPEAMPDKRPNPPRHRHRHTVVHCAPALPEHALSSCPVLVLGEEEEPAPEPEAAPPPPPPNAVVTPSRPIIITHEMVEKLQSDLQTAGNYSGPVSGVFDLPTRNALIAWQRAHGKKPTGSLNATTLEDFDISRQ